MIQKPFLPWNLTTPALLVEFFRATKIRESTSELRSTRLDIIRSDTYQALGIKLGYLHELAAQDYLLSDGYHLAKNNQGVYVVSQFRMTADTMLLYRTSSTL